jgi:hypothetical protein
MTKELLIGSMLTMALASQAWADGTVRVSCEEEDEGAQISFDEQFVGECPLLIFRAPGTYQMRVQKEVPGGREKVFEKTLTITEGTVQRIEVTLSAPRLTAQGKREQDEAEASRLQRNADRGDADAMDSLAALYDVGTGVSKDPAQAKVWRDKASRTRFQAQFQAAQAGDANAMRKVAGFYAVGEGVAPDASQSEAWREKALASDNAKATAARVEDRQRRANGVNYFEHTKSGLDDAAKGGVSSWMTFSIPSSMIGMFSDALSAPSKSTELAQIKSEAVMRPAAWGNPDSMIAQASRRLDAERGEASTGWIAGAK